MGNQYTQYKSSRWTRGNLFFPDTLSVENDGVYFEKRRLIGSKEEIVNYQHIASVKVNSRLFFATLVIESSGGSNPVKMCGLKRRLARQARIEIQKKQSENTITASNPAIPVP